MRHFFDYFEVFDYFKIRTFKLKFRLSFNLFLNHKNVSGAIAKYSGTVCKNVLKIQHQSNPRWEKLFKVAHYILKYFSLSLLLICSELLTDVEVSCSYKIVLMRKSVMLL